MNIIDSHFFHALAFIRRSKLSFHRRRLFVFRRDTCFSIPQCQCGSAAYKPSSICSNTTIRLVMARLDRQTTLSFLKRLWKSFIIIWTTWYNIRKCAVEHACKFSAIHVKNTYQLQLFSFVNVSLLSWNKMASNFGNDRLSLVSCRIRFHRMAIVGSRFIFLGFDWLRRHSIVTLTSLT